MEVREESDEMALLSVLQAFASVAGRRGGDAKLVGNVISPSSTSPDTQDGKERSVDGWWHEVSIVHYPR